MRALAPRRVLTNRHGLSRFMRGRLVLAGLMVVALAGCAKLMHLPSGGYVVSPVARTGASAVVLNDALYLIGGQTLDEHGADGGSFLKSVMRAPIGADGSLGTWTEVASLDFPRGYSSALTYRDSIYLVGGYKDNNPGTSGAFGDVLRASVQADGTLSPWKNVATQAGSIARAGAAIVNDNLFVVGGVSGSGSSTDSVVRYPIQADGSLSLPVTVGRLNGPRNRFALVSSQAGGMGLYAIGGYRGGFPYTYDDSVERLLWPTESSTPVSESQPRMEARRGGHTAQLVGNSIVVVGGYDGAQYLDSVDVGTLNAMGQVTGWKTVAHLKMPRSNHAAAVHNGSLYVLGGGNRSGLMETVERLDLKALGIAQ